MKEAIPEEDIWPNLENLIFEHPPRLHVTHLILILGLFWLFNSLVLVSNSVMRVGSDTFGDPIYQKGLQN